MSISPAKDQETPPKEHGCTVWTLPNGAFGEKNLGDSEVKRFLEKGHVFIVASFEFLGRANL